MGWLTEWWRSYRTRVMRPLVVLSVLPALGVTSFIFVVTCAVLVGRPNWPALFSGRGVLVLDGRALLFLSVALLVALLISASLASKLLNSRASPLLRVEEGARALAEGRYDVRIQLPPNSGLFSQTLAGHLNGLAESLTRTEQARRELVTNLAHELRTPLTNVQGYLEALRDEVLEATPDSLASVHEEVMRLVRLHDGIYQLARVDAVRARRPSPQPTDLDQIAREVLVLLTPVCEERALRIHVDWGLKGRLVNVHADSMAQVLRNLIRNATIYTEEGGVVHIQSSLTAGVYRFVCINSGPGIDESDLPHIFNRFYRTDRSAKAHPTGVGVGLPIARELVEAHNGRVGAESKQGWTTFWIEVPCSASGEVAP